MYLYNILIKQKFSKIQKKSHTNLLNAEKKKKKPKMEDSHKL